MTTLRSPFAEALQEALRHAREDHAYPGWMLEKRWRHYLEEAQGLADLRAAGELPNWRSSDVSTLSRWLLAFIGDDPPGDLLDEIDRQVRLLEANDPGANRRPHSTETSVASSIRTLGTIRHLIERFRPNRRLS